MHKEWVQQIGDLLLVGKFQSTLKWWKALPRARSARRLALSKARFTITTPLCRPPCLLKRRCWDSCTTMFVRVWLAGWYRRPPILCTKSGYHPANQTRTNMVVQESQQRRLEGPPPGPQRTPSGSQHWALGHMRRHGGLQRGVVMVNRALLRARRRALRGRSPICCTHSLCIILVVFYTTRPTRLGQTW
jgi:hypothetical protein